MRKSFVLVTLAISIVHSMGASRPADQSRFYAQHNLVSDRVGQADTMDPALVNAWGLVASSSSPWWISDNGMDLSTLYRGDGTKVALNVSVPGAPTGVVFNTDTSGTAFVVSSGGASAAARFIFATEDGTILGWNPGVPPPPTSTQAVLAQDLGKGAVYKGLAIASNDAGAFFLYATDFHNGTVDVFDSNFDVATLPPGAFTDPSIPDGFAPFGIQNIKNVIVVTYAMQDADKVDDVPGEGHGFVDAFDISGNLLGRIASRETLNSPWGLALAPDDFGTFSGALLVGNFGDGRIHAYDPDKRNGRGEFQRRGMLHSAEGNPIQIDGLWALQFGMGGAANGPANVLFFTAGPDEESHGLFGKLEAVLPPGLNR